MRTLGTAHCPHCRHGLAASVPLNECSVALPVFASLATSATYSATALSSTVITGRKPFRRVIDEAARLGVEGEPDQPDGASVGEIGLGIPLLAYLRERLVHRLVNLQLEDVDSPLVLRDDVGTDPKCDNLCDL